MTISETISMEMNRTVVLDQPITRNTTYLAKRVQEKAETESTESGDESLDVDDVELWLAGVGEYPESWLY